MATYVLRSPDGMPQVETDSASEFIEAVDANPDWYWDDNETLNIDTIRDHAKGEVEARKAREAAIKEGLLNKDGSTNYDHPDNEGLKAAHKAAGIEQ